MEILELQIRGIVSRYQCNRFFSVSFFRETQQEIGLWSISESLMKMVIHSRNVLYSFWLIAIKEITDFAGSKCALLISKKAFFSSMREKPGLERAVTP